MKRIAIIVFFICSGILCSCEKADETALYKNLLPATQYELDDLQDAFKSSIDSWQMDNQYSESLLCGKVWDLSKRYVETYIDGELSETSDFPFHSSSSKYFFNENHSMRINDSRGAWLYVKNHIIMRHDGSYYDYEVAGVTRRTLVLKSELYPAGGITTPFYIDKSGKHEFIIQEFQAK